LDELEEAAISTNTIDVRVGACLRANRRSRGYSQTQLASALGLTDQQIDDFETGSVRIGAVQLYALSLTLEVPPSSFFEKLGRGSRAAPDAELGPSTKLHAPYSPHSLKSG
jgi:transcriptional regulator with XRE-family HTH domain